METRKKKTLMLVAISLFSIAIVSFGTYAIWNSELLTGNNSISSGQVLHSPYKYEKARLIVREMIDLLSLDLTDKQKFEKLEELFNN